MIHAASWFTPQHHGLLTPPCSTHHSSLSTHHSPPTESDLLALIARPIKYFSRMTPETQLALCAASIALRTLPHPDQEIGLLAAGVDGTLAANAAYFTDYLSSGRSLARGNLFVYTLPTSAASAISLALSLRGPALHLHDTAAPLAALVHHAHQMLADHEADTLLALYSDPTAAICLAITADPPTLSPTDLSRRASDLQSTLHLDLSRRVFPSEFAATLRTLVPTP